MYKRSRKTKGVSRRLAALLLCCACLFGAVSVSAIALEAEASPVTDVPARASILEDSGTKSDNTEPAPTTEPTAPTETKAPAETTAPTEAPAPAETTAPAGTTAPTETTAPAETTAPTEANDPTEPETTAPAETPAPTDPEEGIAPVSEDPETTGTAEPEKDPAAPAENGETPEGQEALEDEETAEPAADAPETLSVYDRLMAAATCEEAAAVFDDPENEEALLALTLQQLTTIREHINTLEEDEFGRKAFVLNALDELVAKAEEDGDDKEISVYGTLSVTNVLTDAEAAYVLCTGTTANLNLQTVTSGQTITVNSSTDGKALIFFVKPADGYLLTRYSSDKGVGMSDLYGFSVAPKDSNIWWFKQYPDEAQKMLEHAKSQGYVGYYAFTLTGQTYSNTFRVTGEKPQMTVTAVANPNSDLKPGDEVEFKITIIPGELNVVASVTEKKITSLRINGTEYTATPNEDGTYSVKYVITQDDWEKKTAVLNVDAELTYEYACGVEDSSKVESVITTKSTVKNSATCSVTFATKKGVLYTLQYDCPAGITPPSTIPAAPVDNDSYFTGKDVEVKEYNRKAIDDPINQGTWTFTGWECGDKRDLQAGDKVQMTGDSLLFTGTWKFTPYPTHVLTIQKTVSGNMQDANKAFAFTIRSDDKDMTYNGNTGKEFIFDLRKDQSVTITVPVGANVTVTENRNGYVQSIGSGTTIPETNREPVTDGIKFTMPDADSILVFNNDKNITVDTGILLDSLPYVLILVLVGVGAVLFVKKRHGRDDD